MSQTLEEFAEGLLRQGYEIDWEHRIAKKGHHVLVLTGYVPLSKNFKPSVPTPLPPEYHMGENI
jgi:hypothetical protein